MNFSFTLKTRKKMNPEIILGNVQANLNYQLLAIELEFPRVVFMLENESSRAVELLRTDDGYEVRLPLMSSIPDLRAALILVDFLMYAAGVKSFQALGKTFFSTSAFWNEKNLNFLMETFTEKMRSAILRSPDRLIRLETPLRDLCIGPDLMRRAGVTMTSSADRFHTNLTKAMAKILFRNQKYCGNKTSLYTCQLNAPQKMKSVSYFSYPRDNDLDWLGYRELLLLEDTERKESIEIYFRDFPAIAPKKWTRFDEIQYDIQPLTQDEWDTLYESARPFQWDRNFDPSPQTADASEPISLPQYVPVGTSFGYAPSDGRHQDFGYSQEDVDLLLKFGEAIIDGTSDYLLEGDLEGDLGILYEKGIGVPQDIAKAVFWYEKAVENGDDYSRCNLADILRKGTGGYPKDLPRAFEIYRTVQQPYGPFRVGHMYEYGLGVEKDMKKAVEWYLRGQDHWLAARRLRELNVDPETGEFEE